MVPIGPMGVAVSLASDPERLEDTHAAWEVVAEKAIKDLERLRMAVRKVEVDVNELQKWCIGERRPLDGSARAEYATYKMNRESGQA